MPNILQLTSFDGDPFWINMNLVVTFYSAQQHTVLVIQGTNEEFYAKETPAEINQALYYLGKQ